MRATTADQASITTRARELRRTAYEAIDRPRLTREENNARRARIRVQHTQMQLTGRPTVPEAAGASR